MAQQSSGEFASTDPITRTQDTRFQERRIGTSFLSVHEAVHNNFNVQRHLISARTHRAFTTSALQTFSAQKDPGTGVAPVDQLCGLNRTSRVPIEIGWAFIDTATGEIQSESHLVKPPLHWDMQPVWDPDAEKLHRISLEQLLAQGRPPFEVARRMNEVLAGELFSDAPADDERWLRIIFDEAGLDRHSRSGEPTLTCSHRSLQRRSDGTAPAMRPPSQKRTAILRERIVHWAALWRMISKGTAARPRTD